MSGGIRLEPSVSRRPRLRARETRAPSKFSVGSSLRTFCL
jgi:hypothetical protein